MSWQFAAWLMLGDRPCCCSSACRWPSPSSAVNILGAIIWLGGEPGLEQLARNSVISITSFSLTPIPLFVLMGEVLFHTGIAVKVIDGVERLIAQVPGRLAVVAVVAGTIFSAISGSTIATTAMLGSLMVPVMLARGYHPTMATGPVMAIGAVDMLIPPSALTVLLGSFSGISISKLLIGGVMPGLILSVAFVAYIVIRVKLKPELAPPTPLERYHGLSRFLPFVQYVVPLVSIFVIVVASMSAGWATPTESAAIGAFATMAMAVVYRALTPAQPATPSLRGTLAISSIILFIIVGATTFAQILSFSGASNGLVGGLLGLGLTHDDDRRRHDGDPHLPRHLRRPGEHDADHAADLHADRAAHRHRPGVVRRHVPDLHAARPAAAAARPAADDHARRGAAAGDHGAHLRRRWCPT